MSTSALSARVFAVYLFILGPVLVFAPNLLLSLFRIAPAHEVWIRVVGLLVFNIGVYVWISATSGRFWKRRSTRGCSSAPGCSSSR